MSDDPLKCEYYLRLTRLVVDVGTDVARKLFYHFKPKKDVQRFFKSSTILDEIYTLKRQHVISINQFQKLNTDPDPETFDLSLLVLLLTNLFKWTIFSPKNGWDKEIMEDDVSLGADLIRLKDIRNYVVGHHPSARIARDDFEKLWKKTETVILRIANFLFLEDEFRSVITHYWFAELENGLEKKYHDLVQKWYKENTDRLAGLQQRVETYLKKAEEFQVFFTNVPECYWRYILLLYEGGMTVMGSLLEKLLAGDNTGLDDILVEHKDQLLKSPSVAIHIFRDSDHLNTNITTWGLSTLAKVIQIVFSSQLEYLDAAALDEIKKAAETFAETAIDSLDSNKFRHHWTRISTSINTLALGLDKETQLECIKLIRKHDQDKFDEDAAKSYVQLLQRDCTPFKSIFGVYLETRDELKTLVEQMNREGISFARDQIVDLKMMTFGETEEKKKLAEAILYTVWNEAVKRTGNNGKFPDVKRAVDLILEGITNIKGVKILSSEKACIIVRISCSSYYSVLALLNFLEDDFCWEHLGTKLSAVCGEEVVVTGFITFESMWRIAGMWGEKPQENS